MPAKTDPASGLYYGWDLGESGWNEEMDANLLRLGRFAFHPAVIARDLATPPGSPSTGDAYIVAATATDDWLGMEGQIALWDGTEWVFSGAPREGWRVWVEEEARLVVYQTAAWVGLAAAIAEPAIDTGALDLPVNGGGILDVTLTEDVTAVTLSGVVEGEANRFRLRLAQDATGGRAWTNPASWQFPAVLGAYTPTATAAAVDYLEGISYDDGASWIVTYHKDISS